MSVRRPLSRRYSAVVLIGRIGLTILGSPVARDSRFGLPDSLLELMTTPQRRDVGFRWCCQRFCPTTFPTEEKSMASTRMAYLQRGSDG